MKRSAADPGRWTAAPEKRKKKNGNEFWELLQQHQGDLTKSGRTVADYLVQHAAEAQYLSISSLAKECCVAEATVFRFCRALGFEGYHEMRIALAQANATGALVNQHVPEPDADTATLCEHASALLMTTINGTQNNLSPEAVDKASELMHKARQVYCLGQGGSMYIANDICARFACISTSSARQATAYAADHGQPDDPGGCGAVRFLFRRYPRYAGNAARGQGGGSKDHSAHPL